MSNQTTDPAAASEQEPDDTFPVPQSVPRWDELPDYAQTELGAGGWDAEWFARQAAAPIMRLTVLNLYVKLKGLSLWQFVGKESESQPGCLHFLASALPELKATLRERDEFTDPQDSPDSWDSREKRGDGALHFKHFTGWPEEKVQAHIDPHGLLLHNPLWWLMPVIPLGQLLAHAADPTGYTEVYTIRELLLDQGWDKGPLTGKR